VKGLVMAASAIVAIAGVIGVLVVAYTSLYVSR
jgi:hypothetical protein